MACGAARAAACDWGCRVPFFLLRAPSPAHALHLLTLTLTPTQHAHTPARTHTHFAPRARAFSAGANNAHDVRTAAAGKRAAATTAASGRHPEEAVAAGAAAAAALSQTLLYNSLRHAAKHEMEKGFKNLPISWRYKDAAAAASHSFFAPAYSIFQQSEHKDQFTREVFIPRFEVCKQRMQAAFAGGHAAVVAGERSFWR
jgi:hypothetical protein